jgi:phage shock protein C
MAVYCRNCGASMSEEVRFCAGCGAAAPVQATSYARANRPLIRPRAGRMIAGVCQGVANQYGWDPAWVRFITVLATVFLGGLGAVGYAVLWVVMAEEPLALPPGVPYSQPGPPYSAGN